MCKTTLFFTIVNINMINKMTRKQDKYTNIYTKYNKEKTKQGFVHLTRARKLTATMTSDSKILLGYIAVQELFITIKGLG